MRVGLVIYGSLHTISGGYLYDRQLVRTLRNAGDVVELISLPWSRYERHILHNVRPSLARRLRYGRYDILLQDELNHPSLYLINERLKRQTNLPLVSIVHHLRSSERQLPQQRATARRLERRYLRSVDGFIYNSRTTRQVTEDLAGASRPHVVAYPAADHVQNRPHAAHIRKRAAIGRPIRLLFAGNVIPRKGVHTLLAALQKLPAGSWELSIVGDLSLDRPYTATLQNLAGASMPSAAINWHGRLPDAALWRLMADHDLLVVPSSYEGFGIVYLEGMAFGLPAIGTTSGAANELITEGVNGYLVAPGNAAELAGRIRALQEDRRLLYRLSMAARERFLNAPTWEQSMSTIRQFLLQMSR